MHMNYKLNRNIILCECLSCVQCLRILEIIDNPSLDMMEKLNCTQNSFNCIFGLCEKKKHMWHKIIEKTAYKSCKLKFN